MFERLSLGEDGERWQAKRNYVMTSESVTANGSLSADRPYMLKKLLVWTMSFLVWPLGVTSSLTYRWFGKEEIFGFSAKLLSLLPGRVGQYVRAAFYKMTLEESHYDLMVGFCSYFAHPTARVGRRVGTGSFAIIGTVDIGDDVLIASRVSIMSGKYQHLNRENPERRPNQPLYERVQIGQGTWLGEGSLVMASIGTNCIVSAGSVVTKPMPDHMTAIGNPARFLPMGGYSDVRNASAVG
jgi:acetyltransferase-like isoleucine patch superfamily enzyme